MTDSSKSRNSESLGMDRGALVEYAQAVFDEDRKARNGNGGRPGTSTELLLAMGVLEHLRCAPSETRDSIRLDWMQKHLYLYDPEHNDAWADEGVEMQVLDAYEGDIRKAIDAAMEEVK